MPSIAQNYRPSQALPRPSTHSTRTRIHSERFPSFHIQPGDTAEDIGGGCGGDIRISAGLEATSDPDTLNSINMCIFRNSRHKFEQKAIWLVRKDLRHEEILRPSWEDREFAAPQFRKDSAFFEEIRWRYKTQLRGSFRRYVSFKTVSTARLLVVCYQSEINHVLC
jgi:hypothetical protein